MKSRRIEKSLAQEALLTLISALEESSETVEIIDRGKSVAVLLSYRSYQALLRKSKTPKAVPFELVGSLRIAGDIEAGSREIAEEFKKSIERTAADL